MGWMSHQKAFWDVSVTMSLGLIDKSKKRSFGRHQEGSPVQLQPRDQNLRPKPTRGERRKIRRSPAYLELRASLGVNDTQALLLIQLGDFHLAHVGQQVTCRPWSRSHVLIGLKPRLFVTGAAEISAPWMVRDADLDVDVSIASPGSVLFIHRRHQHLVGRLLAGAAESVGRLTRAASHNPPAHGPAKVSSHRQRDSATPTQTRQPA